jgi:two-component system, LytTR family, response regulator
MIGRTLSHYRVLSELGHGGMGIVYRAQDIKLDREVALKVLTPALVSDAEQEQRFLTEARTAAALSHPSITVVHEIDTDQGVTFIAMELIRGDSLAGIIARERLPLARILGLAIEIADGLAEGHAQGVVHRDLKPSNVMVTESGRAKLIDFGLAKPPRAFRALDSDAATPARGLLGLERLTSARGGDTPGLIGTAAYMSPEQARGESVDARSDVFAFGALLFELLTGRCIFRRPSAVETLHAILKEPTPRLLLSGAAPEVASDLMRILDKCLEKEPAHRYPSASDLAVDLRAACRRLDQHSAGAVALATGGALRVVIVDDEEPARAVLREYLGPEANLEIVAECANGFEAVKAVADLKPDLVFLDIQMPKLDGFEVLELIGSDVAVIFVTAFDDHAVRAFEVNAVDYLLKPVTRERVEAAVARVRARIATHTPPLPPIAQLVSAARPDHSPAERIVVRDGARVDVIPIDRIDYIQAQDDYVSLKAQGREHLKQQTLTEIAESLPANRFVRIHRSYLLNIDRLSRLETDARDNRIAVLRDGTRLPVSRAGYARLKALL